MNICIELLILNLWKTVGMRVVLATLRVTHKKAREISIFIKLMTKKVKSITTATLLTLDLLLSIFVRNGNKKKSLILTVYLFMRYRMLTDGHAVDLYTGGVPDRKSTLPIKRGLYIIWTGLNIGSYVTAI